MPVDESESVVTIVAGMVNVVNGNVRTADVAVDIVEVAANADTCTGAASTFQHAQLSNKLKVQSWLNRDM